MQHEYYCAFKSVPGTKKRFQDMPSSREAFAFYVDKLLQDFFSGVIVTRELLTIFGDIKSSLTGTREQIENIVNGYLSESERMVSSYSNILCEFV